MNVSRSIRLHFRGCWCRRVSIRLNVGLEAWTTRSSTTLLGNSAEMQ